MAIAYLGLGSNLGDRYGNLKRGIELLSAKLRVQKTSSIYETEPWGYAGQPRFLNMVCRAEAALSPMDLLRVCQQVEVEVGRSPTFRYGPRVLDIDILSYGNETMESPDLVLPHPRLAERAFALVPLAEIAPDWVHPKLGKNASQLLEGVGDRESVRKRTTSVSTHPEPCRRT